MRKAPYVMGILDDEDVEWMASHGQRLGVRKDEILIREGEPVDAPASSLGDGYRGAVLAGAGDSPGAAARQDRNRPLVRRAL